MAKLPKFLPAQKGEPALVEHEEPAMESVAPKKKKVTKPDEKKTKPSGGTDMVAP